MIYAVGDIHGHIDKLRDAHAAIREDMARQNVEQATIVHVGDLCDRGPATKDVVQYLHQLHRGRRRVRTATSGRRDLA